MKAVECLPDEYNDSSFLPPPPPPKQPLQELSASEKAKLNKYARILIMSDNRKAAAIGEYVKNILKRELIPQPDPAPADQNCAFRGVLYQMPNHEYFFNVETGEVYGGTDLRNQMVSFCVENADDMFNKLKLTLDKPFKEWLLNQLDPLQESDHSTILALRHMLQVSFVIFLWLNNLFQHIFIPKIGTRLMKIPMRLSKIGINCTRFISTTLRYRRLALDC